ncbi:DEKNAAC103916 [Brettanomyces naardenensis]|uniref:Peptide hydrolase n=1 Tax=Brettanomyces naardenensis TaxID=13370 RepID=A0A448YPM2_BRENA|nr:DEKNAAC103916 [Brettanomyces naardenensis]
MINQQDVFNSDSQDSRIIYFESANILVKIQGSNPSLESLLVSAHYDSTPPSYGATDDGIGITTLLGILEHFADKSTPQPLRSIVLNFNDDEEFGLLGAELFMKHPWSHDTKLFVNLDGAGAGGRAALLRSTDSGVLEYYKSGVKKPFGNSVFQQGFKGNLVSSETDFHVYSANGMRGIDIDFYKPRSLYHTRRDSVSETSKGSLWHMESMTLDYVETLAYLNGPVSDDNSQAVYFDLLGRYFVLIPVPPLAVFNILLLVVLPVLIIGLVAVTLKRGTWKIGVNGWLRLPISLSISIVLAVLYAQNFLLRDSIVLSNGYVSPLLALLSLGILVNYLILSFFDYTVPVHDQKLVILLELSVVSWISVIWATAKERNEENTAVYLPTLVFALFGTATVLGLLGMALKPRYREREVYGYGSVEPIEREVNGETAVASPPSPSKIILGPSHASHLSESHPLLSPVPPEPVTEEIPLPTVVPNYSFDWSLQFIIVVPLLLFSIYSVGDLILQAIHQTGQDSAKSGATAVKLLLGLSIAIGIPILPFSHKLNAAVAVFFGLTFIVGSALSYWQAPSSYENPIKLRFWQTIDLGTAERYSNSSIPVSTYANVHGRKGHVLPVLSELPSLEEAGESGVSCEVDKKLDTETCRYEAARPWLIDGSLADNSYDDYFSIEVISNSNRGKSAGKYDPLSATLEINAAENRMCVISFNSSGYSSENPSGSKEASPVKLVTVYNWSVSDKGGEPRFGEPIRANIPSGYSRDDEGNHYYKLMRGIDLVQVHKLNWTQPAYRVGLQWLPFSLEDGGDEDSRRNLGVTVKCYWGEFDSEVDVAGEKRRMLPGWDEAVQFAPESALFTNMKPGLLEISGHIEL